MIQDIIKRNPAEYVTDREPLRSDVIALFYGATGLTAEASFGNVIKCELESINIRVIYISGPAAIIDYRLHGHSEKGWLGLLHLPKEYYAGNGRGGINSNVNTGLNLITELIKHKYLDRDATVLLEGWSRGAISAQRLTHALLKWKATKYLHVNMRLEEPVIGGKPVEEFYDRETTQIANNVIKFRISYAIDDILPHLHPITIYHPASASLGKLNTRNLSRKINIAYIRNSSYAYLPCTHVGMNWPSLSIDKQSYQLTILLRKLDWNLGLNQGELKHLLELYSLLSRDKLEHSLESIFERLQKIHSGMNTNVNSSYISFRIMSEIILGRLPLYRNAMLDTRLFSPRRKTEFLLSIKSILEMSSDVHYKIVSMPFLYACLRVVKPFSINMIKLFIYSPKSG